MSNLAEINQEKLNEIVKNKKKTSDSYSNVEYIVSKTERVLSGLYTRKGEFRYKNIKPVKGGIPYHIRYTTDLKEYFITGASYNKQSEIIYRNIYSNFSYYNSLNKQSVLTIPENRVTPTEADYQMGFYKRYFAKKANDLNSTPFEIEEEFYQSSPLYNYVSVKWFISGTELDVYDANIKSILTASRTVDISNIVFKQQYFRLEKSLSPKSKVIHRLGRAGEIYQQIEENTSNEY